MECALKRLRMMLHKSHCDSNGCELPNEQATPPTLAREMWPGRLQEKIIAKNISFGRKHLCQTTVRQRLIYLDLSMLIIDEDPKLDRNLDCTNIHEHELTDLPM